MREIEDIITDKNWLRIFNKISENQEGKEYIEKIGFTYSFDPFNGYMMSKDKSVLDPVKLKAMHDWYKKGDRFDTSICRYFDEYKGLTDKDHPRFNSNYGYYAYTLGGIRRCAERLKKDSMTRQAYFCINNEEAMQDSSIDKLCTNGVFFCIRDQKLQMVVQMRSSNFFSLLPYDACMFAMFYKDEFSLLKEKNIKRGKIIVNACSIHYYKKQLDRILKNSSY